MANNTTTPSTREVASGVINLGNTCYMNAVLQALAHAPELIQAMELDTHHTSCPIYIRTQKTKAKEQQQADANPSLPGHEGPTKGGNASINNVIGMEKQLPQPKKKKKRKSPSRSVTPIPPIPKEDFCILCEFEQLIKHVHSDAFAAKPNPPLMSSSYASSNNNMNNNQIMLSDAVAPSAFVHGFVTHVAPWFRLGVQEDSHEFLRLLIDAMQKSAISSRTKEMKTGLGLKSVEEEYPFTLFRGTVESIVTCSKCGATTTKIDPMEDIGLDVTPPPPQSSSSLCDVITSLGRFTTTERLDTHYKCDACHAKGTCTKQSRLGSIPPILSLHLKRFRYGGGNTATVTTTSRRSRDKLADVGTSGSAKMEGHVKFEQVFNIKPYLTQELQSQTKSMFCRLFAVIVHAGKNSHSGHYIAYVRNVKRNEWWKMDDAKVQRVDPKEVMMAEAYMLFYRVVDHPIAVDLRRREEEFLAQKKRQEVEEVERKQKEEVELEREKKNFEVKASMNARKRKREVPKYTSLEQWAGAWLNHLPDTCLPLLKRAVEYCSENIDFRSEYFSGVIMDEADRGGKLGMGPVTGVDFEDLQADGEPYVSALTQVMAKIVPHLGQDFIRETENIETISNEIKNEDIKLDDTEEVKAASSLIIPVVDPNDTLI